MMAKNNATELISMEIFSFFFGAFLIFEVNNSKITFR